MSLFSPRFIREHFVRRDPGIDTDIRLPGHPVDGDVLVYSAAYERGVYATPPVDPNITTLVNDKDTIWWDATDAQLEAVTPTLALDEVGTLNGEPLVWDTDHWEGAGWVLQQPAYGSVYVQDGAVAQAVTGVAAKLTAFAANGPANLTTPAHADDSVTVLQNGVYDVKFNASFAYADAAVVQMHVRVDGVESVIGFQIESLTAGDILSASCQGQLELLANAVVTVYVEASGGGANITVSDAVLSVERINRYVVP